MAVAAEVEEDHPLLAGLLGGLGLVEGGADRVEGSGAGMIPSQRANCTAAAKAAFCLNAFASTSALLDQGAEARGIAVVAQAAGVHRRRHEVVAERVHRHQRGHPHRVAEVIGVGAAGQRRARGRLGGDEARLLAVAQVRAAGTGRRCRRSSSRRPHSRSTTSGYSPAISICGNRLLADHRLVQADVVEHRAQRVVGVLAPGGDLDRLGDRDPEAARAVLGLRAARLGQLGGAAVNRRRPRSRSSPAGRASGHRRRRP